ncbi:MAG: hypothetical protein JXB35_14020 [Anaerolineae bacterium]|nr:hypothetical protein [Anaerolineae bacterium]
MNKRKGSLVMSVGLALLLLATVGIVLAGDVVIDSFSAGAMSISHTISDTVFSYPVTFSDHVSVAGPLGGYRDLCLTVVDGNNDATATAYVSTGSNNYVVQDLGNTVQARTLVQWDGNDGDCALDPVGLVDAGSGEDLTDGGTNDGMLLRIVASDGRPVDFEVRLYTDADNWGQRNVSFASVVDSGDVVDLFLPFSTFDDDGAGTLEEDNVGAVELLIDASASSSAGADMTVDLIKTTSVYEYGDVPLTGTLGLPISQTGFLTATVNARHIPLGMRLGDNVDTEAAHTASVPNARSNSNDADGDDKLDTPDDEDGVVKANRQDGDFAPDPVEGTEDWTAGSWTDGDGGGVNITWRGCADSGDNRCRVYAWIDWDRDGVFESGERIFATVKTGSSGSSYQPFTIPAGVEFENVRYYARFRICSYSPGGCTTPDATDVVDGEIEDHYFEWGTVPLAVTLAAFDAVPQDGAVVVTWETALEVNTLGFNLYRADTESGARVRLNNNLIPTQHPGMSVGGAYSWVDATVVPGGSYFYWLEELDAGNTLTLHGPVTAEAAGPSAVKVLEFSAGSGMLGSAAWLAAVVMVGAVWTWRRKR